MGIIVVGGVIEKDGKFLLVQEAKEKFRGKWNLLAGRLENNETLFDGAKREIFEECGCRVELTGVLQIGNKLIENDSLVSVIFSTKLLEDNIVFNEKEILNVKWFTYEEILNMKDELRSYGLIEGAISAFLNNRISNIDIVKIT